MRTESFKKNIINDQMRTEKYSKESERRVRAWPTIRVTFESPLLEKVLEERVGKRSDPTGTSLVRRREESECGPILEPAYRQAERVGLPDS